MFMMVSDKYGEPHQITKEQFLTDCKELGWTVKLAWHTDGKQEWYTDQDGDVVLEQQDRRHGYLPVLEQNDFDFNREL